ncbi:hypothetical protein, partial [Duganella sp. Root1480D1]|uniref:hypothetical protein n=1 Tax=Duganella sp. Root1480D1 TaxID=1736471 RepID=UPI00138F80DA
LARYRWTLVFIETVEIPSHTDPVFAPASETIMLFAFWRHSPYSGTTSQDIFSMRLGCRPGLVQQTVQIVASHDLTLFVMFEQSAANDRMDYERIGRFIYSFHRVSGSVDELNVFASDVNVPPELAARAANLACILKNCGSIAEGELESTLREASEVQTGIQDWRSRNVER